MIIMSYMNFSDKARPVIEKKSKYEKHAELFGAFAYSDTLTLCLLLPEGLGAENVMLRLWNDDAMSNSVHEACRTGARDGFDVFEYTFDFAAMCENGDNGLFYYNFEFVSDGKRLFVSRSARDLMPEICENEWEVSSYQLTVYSDNFTTPDSLKGAVMYQIFPDRFAKGEVTVPVREDAVINGDWYDGIPEYPEYPGAFIRNNMFFGGTLWGVIEKLDYLCSLGVDVIYLNPIFEAYSNHKYDTGNYMKVDAMLGGDKAFDALVGEASHRGIRIILDGVFNHTGSDSIYFNKNKRYDSVGAYNSSESEYYDWYLFDKYPDKYKSWWGIDILPKINGKNKAFREFICGENGVIRHYLKRGAYGWRLDVADELDEDLLEGIRASAKALSDAPIIGEVWEDASNKVAYDRRRRYLRGHELDSVMNYPLRSAVIALLQKGDSEGIARTTTELYSHYPKQVSDVLMNFLGTHDTERILTVLSGEDISSLDNSQLSVYKMSDDGYARAVKALKLAYLIISTVPGIPCIYYGDEAGVEGARDPFNRKCYPWGRENGELVSWYKDIGRIRKSEPVFKDGYYRVLECKNGVFVFERFKDAQSVVVAVNCSNGKYLLESDGVSLLSLQRKACFELAPMTAEIIKK